MLLLLCSNYCYFFIVKQIDQTLHLLDMPPAAAFAGAAVFMCISTNFREMLLLSLLRINRCTKGMRFFCFPVFLYNPEQISAINLKLANWICFCRVYPEFHSKNLQVEWNVESSSWKKALCLDFVVLCCPALYKKFFSYVWMNSVSTILCTWIISKTDGKVKEISIKVKGNCWSSAGEGQQAAGERRQETWTLKAEKENWRTYNSRCG